MTLATIKGDDAKQLQTDREFRRLHACIIYAQETERKRLARELHDGVSQILLGAKFALQTLLDETALSPSAKSRSAKVCGLLDHAISEIRHVSHNLMPAELENLGLETALRTLSREFKEHSGVSMTVRTVPSAAKPELALALFRIAQEALNNIGKHSQATMVTVALSRKGKDIFLSVSDNGIGFKLGYSRQPAGRGFGLGNMRQRVESVGGSLEVHSTPEAGTTLNVRAPLAGLRGDAA